MSHAGSFTAGHRLCSCGTRAAEPVGFSSCGVLAYCSAACGVLVPGPGIKAASPALQGGFLTTGPPGKSLLWRLKHPHCRVLHHATKENKVWDR